MLKEHSCVRTQCQLKAQLATDVRSVRSMDDKCWDEECYVEECKSNQDYQHCKKCVSSCQNFAQQVWVLSLKCWICAPCCQKLQNLCGCLNFAERVLLMTVERQNTCRALLEYYRCRHTCLFWRWTKKFSVTHVLLNFTIIPFGRFQKFCTFWRTAGPRWSHPVPPTKTPKPS